MVTFDICNGLIMSTKCFDYCRTNWDPKLSKGYIRMARQLVLLVKHEQAAL